MFSFWLYGLILEKYSKVRYILNSYLLSTELCTNLICFNSYQNEQLINDISYIYVTPNSSINCNPYEHYCSQTKYMHKLSDINTLSEKLVNLAFKYACYIRVKISFLTYPD